MKDESPPEVATENLSGVFGLWETASADREAAVSFGATSASPTSEMAVWRLNLPSDPREAIEQLTQVETQVKTSAGRLAAIPRRLDQFMQHRQTTVDHGLSFAAAAGRSDLAQPEIEILHLLDEMQGGESEVSFGLTDKLGNWKEANAQFQAVMARLSTLIGHYAWVETQVQETRLAQTIVGWTGDMRTAWGSGFSQDQLTLHQQSVKLALASRQTTLRTVVIATQGAAKIAALLAMPGGALLALPVAWKYINQILAERDN